jgi:hypothetical protein
MRLELASLMAVLAIESVAHAQGVAARGPLPARAVGVYRTATGPVILLEAIGTGLYLPIWVADREAEVAEGYLQRRPNPRPLTHDLLNAVILSLGARVTAVHVSDIQNNTFYGRLDVTQAGVTRQLDARSSDAVCVALASGAPIYIMGHVLAQAGMSRAELAQQGISP